MLSSASRLCKDLSTVQRIYCFLNPFSIFFMPRQLAGWPCMAGVFIQTDPGWASLNAVSISLVVACFSFSPVSLSKRRCLMPFALSMLWPHPIAGCMAAPSPLMEYGPTPSLRYPSKNPLHGGFLRSHRDCLLSEAVLCSCFYLTVIAWEPET